MRFVFVAALIAVTLATAASQDSAPAHAITGPMLQIETYLGTGTAGNTGDSGAPAAASITGPASVAVAPNGDLYVGSGCLVRRVSAGLTSTVVDACAVMPVNDAMGGLAISPAGDVYFGAISGCSVWKAVSGVPVVVAGGQNCNAQGGTIDDVPATSSNFTGVTAIAFDNKGNMFVADNVGCRIRKVDTASIITTVAGSGQGTPFNCQNNTEGGVATAVRLPYPIGVTVADNGDIYIASEDRRVRRVRNGMIASVAGGGSSTNDGVPATQAALGLYIGATTSGLAVDQSGDLYISDEGQCKVRRVSHGIITTITGTGTCTSAGDGGQAPYASLQPGSIAFDSDGTLYVGDFTNSRVRTVFGVALDTDQDGYTDLQEGAIAKDAQTYCSIMRADVDGDGSVTILDLSRVATFFGQAVPPAPPRYRQGPPPFGAGISILDLSKMAMRFGQSVSNCP